MRIKRGELASGDGVDGAPGSEHNVREDLKTAKKPSGNLIERNASAA